MFALIDSEWGIILVVVAVLVLFGGSKLPKLFHSLGSAQAEYKRGIQEGRNAAMETVAGQASEQRDTWSGDGAPVRHAQPPSRAREGRSSGD